MPRKQTYWKDPEKYRGQRKEYYRSHSEYVPRKKKKRQNNTVGSNKTNNKTSLDYDEMVEALELHYSSGYVSKKLKKMRQRGQAVLCQGQAFMPLSTYKKTYKKKPTPTKKTSHQIGEEGTRKLIPYLESCYPSPTYLIYLNPVAERGVDFLITKDGTPHVVIELTNYKKTSYLHSREVIRYVKSLKYWTGFYKDIHKIIMVNYPENLKNNPQWKNSYIYFTAEKIGIKILR